MSIKNNANKKSLIDAMDHVDERYVAELVEDLRLPSDQAEPTKNAHAFRKSLKYAVLVAACALILGAALPVVGVIVKNIIPAEPAGVASDSAETDEIVYPTDLILYESVSPRELTNDEMYEIVTAYLANDSDPNKYAYSYSVRCFGRFLTRDEESRTVYVVMIDSDRWYYPDAERVEKVFFADNPAQYIGFIMPNAQPMLVYCEGEFCSLNEAFERSLLTLTYLFGIRWADRTNVGGSSVFAYPLRLSRNEAIMLTEANPERGTGEFSYRFYGEYNGAYVIFADKEYKYYEPMRTVETVNGLSFVYPTEQRLNVCANGKYYTLTEAFEQALLSPADLDRVHLFYTMEKEISAAIIEQFAGGNEKRANDLAVRFEGIYGDVYAVSYYWGTQKESILVYRGGEFCTLPESIERGLLTEAQAENVKKTFLVEVNR